MTAIPFHTVNKAVEEFCKRWKIVELALFGSVLRDDFRPDSDIDVLVEFASGVEYDYDTLDQIRTELETLFGRPVDLVEKSVIEQSENYIRRRHILHSAQTLYVER